MFKLNSKNANKCKNIIDVKIPDNIKNDLYTSKEDIDSIIDFAYKLPICPDVITVEHIINDVITIRFTRNRNIKGGAHIHNYIKISNDSDNGYVFKICKIDEKDLITYPKSTLTWYSSIKECLNEITKAWKETNLSKSIEKYS